MVSIASEAYLLEECVTALSDLLINLKTTTKKAKDVTINKHPVSSLQYMWLYIFPFSRRDVKKSSFL